MRLLILRAAVEACCHSHHPGARRLLPVLRLLLRSCHAVSKPKAKTLSWAGAGIFFFWQLGAMKYLAERYDLTRVPMAGASGGALAAVLAACGVPADVVLQRAYEMSVKHGIWERPLGLVGIWGSLIEQWLDDLLPADAAERCRGKITIIVTTLPNMGQVGISDFKDKHDLINAAMASAHIPMLLDLKFARVCRGKYCVDGSFPDFFYNDNSELLKAGGSAVIFDYFNDTKLVRKGRMDMLSLKQYEEVKHIMQLGYEYAQGLHQEGHFEHFEVGEMVFDHLEEAAKEHVAAETALVPVPSSQQVTALVAQQPRQAQQ
ncbi:hypothetical protein PLESTF_000733400 [Pleodorina starrii]|nr:hypothetical protein PLESTF_000733400 [Pleodorina starrii]